MTWKGNGSTVARPAIRAGLIRYAKGLPGLARSTPPMWSRALPVEQHHFFSDFPSWPPASREY